MESNDVPQHLRFEELRRKGIVNSWPGLRHLQLHEDFPLGKLLGLSTRVWTASEVNAWLANRPTEPSEQTKTRAARSVAARQKLLTLEHARRRIEALGPPWQLDEPSGKDRNFYIYEPDDWDGKCGPHTIRCRTIEIVHRELDEIEKVARSQPAEAVL
jgi:hypothetical protein